jgi:DNA-binding response OmpR family regulator
MTDQFAKANFQVYAACDGAVGLQTALQTHPDLIILDITMPVMNGLSMLEKLRQDKWGNSVPVMVFTNRDDSSNISNMMHNRTSGYYIKADSKLNDIIEEIKERLPIIQRTYLIERQ